MAAQLDLNTLSVPSCTSSCLLSRRSTGDRNTQLATPADNLAAVRGIGFSGGNKVKPAGRTAVSSANGENATPRTTATTTPAAAIFAEKQSEQVKKRKHDSRRPARGGGGNLPSSPSLSSARATPATSSAAAAADGHHRGRDTPQGLGEWSLGARGAAAAVAAARGEETAGVIHVKQAVVGPKTSATAAGNIDDEGQVETGSKEAAVALTATETIGEAGEGAGNAGAAEGYEPAAKDLPSYGRWPATLDARWAEVEFMLCHEVDCEESLQYTIEATEAGLVFMEKLEEKAQVRGPPEKHT